MHILKQKVANPNTFASEIVSYCGFEKDISHGEAFMMWMDSQQTEGTCKECLREEKKFKLKQLRKK